MLGSFDVHFFRLDIVFFQEAVAKLIVRDQKTSRWTGPLKIDVPTDVAELLHLWITNHWARWKQEGHFRHDFLFLYPKSKKPIGQKGFSGYFKKACRKHLRLDLNLQTMRRVFLAGFLCTKGPLITVFIP